MKLGSLLYTIVIGLSLWTSTGVAEENSAIKQLHEIKDIITSKLSHKEEVKVTAVNLISRADNNSSRVVELLLERKKELDMALSKNNIWSKIYSNYHTYLYLLNEKSIVDKKIAHLKKKRKKSKSYKDELEKLQERKSTILGKLQLLNEYSKDPFKELIKPVPIEEIPVVTNPLAIIGAISFKKKLLSDQEEFNNRYVSLVQIIQKLQEEKRILEELIRLDKKSVSYKELLKLVDEKLKVYKPVLEIFKTTKDVYNKNIDEIKLKLNTEIKKEMRKGIVIGGIVLFFFALFLKIFFFKAYIFILFKLLFFLLFIL